MGAAGDEQAAVPPVRFAAHRAVVPVENVTLPVGAPEAAVTVAVYVVA
jgi:hypothetical protein